MRHASEDLINEHEGILFGLKILEKTADMLEDGKVVDTADLKEIVEFLKLFADKCHHGKEEGLLFPAMERYGIPNERGPIGQMLLEHAEGRRYIAEMAEAIGGDELRRDSFINAARDYIRLLRGHIDKEHNILFPLGDRRIPEDVQGQLLDSFETHEQEVMGPGTHEGLHELLHSLENKYLS